MNLEGSLEAFGLADVLVLLNMTGKTGALRLQRPGAAGVVYVSGGELTGGSANPHRQLLARRLVAAADIPDDDLAAAVAAVQAGTHPTLVQALRAGQAVNAEALREAVREHVVDTIFDLLRWPDGTFGFVLDDHDPDEVGVAMPPAEAIASARTRLEEWASVAESVPSPSTVLVWAAAPPADLAITRDDWALLALADGRRSVGDIVALAGRGEFAVVSGLADLVRRGLLRQQSDSESDSDAGGRRRELFAAVEGRGADVSGPRADTAQTSTVPRARDAGDSAVVPQRGEPFRSTRVPEHPDSLGDVAAADGAQIAVPDGVAALLEQDPSIDRGTLLRLIATVQGL